MRSATSKLMHMCVAVVTASVFHWFAPLARPQTADTVVAQIAKAGGRVSRDDQGKVSHISLSPRTDSAIEAIDFRVFTELKSLTIIARDLTDRSFVHMRATIPPGLTQLAILGGPRSDKELGSLLKKHRSLMSLSLMSSPITDRTLSDIEKLEELGSLSLDGTKITDEGLNSLTKLPNLHFLDLRNTAISDAGLRHIAIMPELRALILEGTKVTDAGIIQLGSLAGLRHLYVSSTNVTEKGKQALQNLLPELEFKKGPERRKVGG
jgi:internalin A